ncbi:uncharacterized protein LOC110737106 isoform X2 [Chenopodium quinoa]|uniref:uncharacterized protein LOC110737106 isoform X2 n=1 Tax=Chenopodium quinoa TaxID=63459 RepID=UPI000B773D6D|nr:uncharacterized protein LOC110737106 isoform X2 [Chenopodium quinoa]
MRWNDGLSDETDSGYVRRMRKGKRPRYHTDTDSSDKDDDCVVSSMQPYWEIPCESNEEWEAVKKKFKGYFQSSSDEGELIEKTKPRTPHPITPHPRTPPPQVSNVIAQETPEGIQNTGSRILRTHPGTCVLESFYNNTITMPQAAILPLTPNESDSYGSLPPNHSLSSSLVKCVQ